MCRLEFKMPLLPAKKQKTPAWIREIQVHKLWTKVYSQKGLTAMHFFSSYLGFCPKHSCHTALAKLCDSWLSKINNSQVVGAVFLDLKKAFNLADHGILLAKTSAYAAKSPPVSFFRSSQCIYVNSEYSSEGIVHYRVPKGSVFGLLFCLFISVSK